MYELLISTLTFIEEIAPTVSHYSPLIITLITGLWINKRLEKYKSNYLLINQ